MSEVTLPITRELLQSPCEEIPRWLLEELGNPERASWKKEEKLARVLGWEFLAAEKW